MTRLTNIMDQHPEASAIGLDWANKLLADELPKTESKLAALDNACAEAGITDAAALADIAYEGIQMALGYQRKH